MIFHIFLLLRFICQLSGWEHILSRQCGDCDLCECERARWCLKTGFGTQYSNLTEKIQIYWFDFIPFLWFEPEYNNNIIPNRKFHIRNERNKCKICNIFFFFPVYISRCITFAYISFRSSVWCVFWISFLFKM